MDQRQAAIVLLGPTGSGKTPLGGMLESKRIDGRRCVHFDFGDNLRQVVARAEPNKVVSQRDIEFLRGVLETGALLEDHDFPIARRVLISFLQQRGVDADTIVVMNGLPRHVGQARALSELLDMRHVIRLRCSAEVVLQRIASNVGGDRAPRTDDDLAAVARKLKSFARRTAPLVGLFRDRGAVIVDIAVTATMIAEEMWNQLQGGKIVF